MEDDGKKIAKRITDLVNEIDTYRENKRKILNAVGKLEADFNAGKIDKQAYEQGLKKYLQGNSKEEIIKQHDRYIDQLFEQIEKEADKGLLIFTGADVEPKKSEVEKKEVVKTGKLGRLGKKQKQAFMKELNLDKEFISLYLKRRDKKKATEVRVEYELYKPTQFGKIANRLFENISTYVAKNQPDLFEPLYNSLRMSGMKVLSKTYISIIIMIGALSFLGTALLLSVVFRHPVLAIQIARGVLLGLFGGVIGMVIAYMYPKSLAKQKSSAIKNELPFMIIHMAAVSGSGAKPISIFKTVLSSGEYPSLRDEVKKVVNYVTLFGYDLSTALKAVAKRTASTRLKDLFDGIVSNIESGGDLKDFLQSKSEEALNTYKLERKRHVESIATYSDIYTAVLIAAPLLFFVTLAIIQTLGGNIAGIPVSTLAKVGTFGVIPALNVAFFIFIDVVAPS